MVGFSKRWIFEAFLCQHVYVLGNTTAAGLAGWNTQYPWVGYTPAFSQDRNASRQVFMVWDTCRDYLQSRGERAWILDASPPASKLNHRFSPELVVHWLATNGHEQRQGGILLCLVYNICCLAAQRLIECWRDGSWSYVDFTPVAGETAILGL